MQETTVNNIINPSQEYEALLINETKMKKKIIIPLPPPNLSIQEWKCQLRWNKLNWFN